MLEAIDIDDGGAKYLPFAQAKLRSLKVVLDGIGTNFGRKLYKTPDGEGEVEIRTRRGRSLVEKNAFLQGKRIHVNPSPYAPDDWIDEWYDYIRISTCKDRKGFLLIRDAAYPQAPWVAHYVDGVVQRIAPTDGTPNPDPTAKRTVGYSMPPELRGIIFDDRNTASRYSGLMREVVGCYHIRGQNAPFSYSWAKTHGIIKFAVDVGEPSTKYWLVEVSANGVYAVPIKNTGKCCGSWGVKHVQPTGKQLDEDPTLEQYVTQISLAHAIGGRPESGVRQLLTAVQMATAYARSPFFSGHGWAFNYSGTEAQAVTQEWKLTPAKHYACSRYKLTFSLANEDDLSCQLTSVEVDQPASFRQGQVWIPTTLGNWIGTEVGDATSLTTFPNQNAPIHVFYTGDQEVVTRFELTNHPTTEVTQNDPPYGAGKGGAFGMYNFNSELREVVPHWGNQYDFVFTPDTFQHTRQSGIVCGFTSSGFNSVHDNRSYTLIDDSLTQTGTKIVEQDTFDIGDNFCRFFYHETKTSGYLLQTRVTNNGVAAGRGSVVLFMGEREAVMGVQDTTVNETVTTQLGTEFQPGHGPGDSQFALMDWTKINNGLNSCNYPNFDSAMSPGGWPFGFHEGLTTVGVAPNQTHTAQAVLAVGPSSYSIDAKNKDGLMTFLQTGSFTQLQTAVSGAFAMHGNLYWPDENLEPTDQKENAAYWLDGLVLVGGFAQADGDPYKVIAFVGKA